MNVETSGEDAQERRPKSAEASAADILANFQKTFGADEWKMDKQESSEYTGMYLLEVLRGIHTFLVLRILPFFLIQTYINALSSSPAVKSAFHYDWPPPTLVLLAILTIVALLVHPDGYTWVILRKIRDSVWSFFQSSSTCWAVVINDYGTILSTIIALATFSALFFLAFVLRKTLSPKPNHFKSVKNKAKKKKKKPNRFGRVSRRVKEDEDVKAGSEALPALEEDKPLSELQVAQKSSPLSPETPATNEVPCKQPKTAMRERAPTGATEDSTIASDDMSFDSVSGRSTPTMEIEKPSVVETKGKSNNKECKSEESRRPKKGETVRASVTPVKPAPAPRAKPAPTTSPASRWDPLKPNNRHGGTPRRSAPPLPVTPKTPLSVNRPGTVVNPSASTHTFTVPERRAISSPKAIAVAPPRTSVPTTFSPQPFLSKPTDNVFQTPVRPDGTLKKNESPFFTPGSVDSSFFTSSWSNTVSNTDSFVGTTPVRAPIAPPPGLSRDTNQCPSLFESPRCDKNDGDSTMMYQRRSVGLSLPNGSSPMIGSSRVKENPFDVDDDDDQIAAELQELGGQMVGSILDF